MENERQFTQDQQKALTTALSGRNLLITGGAGVGKTYILKSIIERMKKEGRNLILCAPTGTAANLLGGVTIHRAFNFRTAACINEKTMKIVSNAPKHLCKADVVVIDEVSMCRMDLMDAVLLSIRKAEKKASHPIQVILCGDFYQLPPVIDASKGDRGLLERYYGAHTGHCYAFQAQGWDGFRFEVIELTETIRQKDPEFVSHLNNVRVGDKVDLSYFSRASSPCFFPDAPYLVPYNNQSDRINRYKIETLPGDLYTFRAKLTGSVGMADIAGVPPVLDLKVNARVILTVNEPDFRKEGGSYHNGSTGTITYICSNVYGDQIRIKLDESGREIWLHQKEFKVYQYTVDGEGNIIRETAGSYFQFPLRPAYAVTIHKAQGQTLVKANINPLCFQPGQLYTALSRVTDICQIYLNQAIPQSSVITSREVVSFYSQARKDSRKSEDSQPAKVQPQIPDVIKTGRRRRFQNGSTTIRVPMELADAVKELIDRVCPADTTIAQDTELLESFLQLCHH